PHIDAVASLCVALALQAALLAAEGSGLGGCPVSALRNALGPVSTLLRLPPGVFPLLGLAVGYPAAPARVSMRLPPAAVLHDEFYRDCPEAELLAYDARRHAREPIPPAKQKQTGLYGLAPVCTWSLNVARQLSVTERADLAAFLRARGFNP
ncbi:MAG TPA: nitroreductase family protein, partial [Opitutaceae bacterium]|nr:nitroreductase family protein [Opitutaceae bacterium]